MKNIFLTGEKQVGKSTIIYNIIKSLDLKLGGYITEREDKNGTRLFTVVSLANRQEKYPIAKVYRNGLEKKIYKENFKYYIPNMLDRHLKNSHLIVLDELGFMENKIRPFTLKVYEILDSEKFVFGVLKAYDCEFLNQIKSRDDVELIEVTKSNRNTIGEYLVNRFKEINIPFK